ncbi:uncharacterized protein FOMMEDRAFT_139558 [Fomitiporia mediterranea MF3/22]|uniref:uncharacterized protein n=1 Tax=Fomitiporia mediterranea (strain MF3/22) TaxID=694068 RepID=UPI0004409176|nr:uncharacterized protein FOMMEDRAFT_139558 [Fomitiporia mediterranea MF3/22]EJD04887.1 hypothetical protein FOMMEDRAFT_139558 [Fomitiporia mediterranea MF3/22]
MAEIPMFADLKGNWMNKSLPNDPLSAQVRFFSKRLIELSLRDASSYWYSGLAS